MVLSAKTLSRSKLNLSKLAGRLGRASTTNSNANARRGLRRALRGEILENRELLAADLSVFSDGAESGPTSIVYQVTLDAPNDTGAPLTFDLNDLSGSATAGEVTGSLISEVGDALDGLNFGDYQETIGSGPLTAISGSLGNGDGTWDPSDDHVDAFKITVTDVGAFFASTVAADGGAYTSDGNLDDPTMYLFDMLGNVVMSNDDKPGVFGGAYLSDPSTFPGDLTNNPAGVEAGTEYVLAITYSTNDAVDFNGDKVVDFLTGGAFKDLHGVAPGAATDFPNNWRNPGDFGNNTMSYTIALGGVTFSNATDYVAIAPDAQIKVAPGESTGTFAIEVLDDSLFEGDETVVMQISNPSNPAFAVGNATATATIFDNDQPKADLSVTTQGTEAGQSSIIYAVTLGAINNTGADLTFELDDLLSGSATAGSDYDAIPTDAQIVVPVGASSGTYTVGVNDDDRLESTETLDVIISGSSDPSFVIGNATATATIADNDNAIASLSVAEHGAEAGPADMVFAVSLDKMNETDEAISFVLADLLTGSAAPGLDYIAFPADATIEVPVGASSGTFRVPVVDDSLLEATDTVFAEISSPSNDAVTIATAEAVASITDNDTAIANFSVTSQGNENGPKEIVYTVTLDKPNDTREPITFEVADLLTGSATAGDDYEAIASGTQIVVPVGETTGRLTVAVVDDTDVEGTETVVAEISSVSNSAVSIAVASVAASILDNDFSQDRTVASVSAE